MTTRLLRGPGSALRRALWFALLVPLLPSALQAQSGAVVGAVLDSETRLTLSGVRVSVQGTDLDGITNPNGRFSLQGVPTGQQTLVFEYLGYGTVSDRRAHLNSSH